MFFKPKFKIYHIKYLKIFEYFNLQEIKDIKTLTSKLKEYNVPIDYWGTGYAKTVEHLMDELLNGECYLKDEGGYLVRYIEFVGIKIFYKDKEGDLFYLKEDRQEFKDGRTRRRNIPSSVSDKMKLGEDLLVSSIRGIEEELGIKVTKNQLIKQRDLYYDGSLQSYPGLKTRYKGYQYNCYLREDQYNPIGYVEVQKDKSTFFVWIKMEQ